MQDSPGPDPPAATTAPRRHTRPHHRPSVIRDHSSSVIQEHYGSAPFGGQGDELNRAARVYNKLFDPKRGEIIPPSLSHRNHAMRQKVRESGGTKLLPDAASSMGASEGIVDASSRPDPSHHDHYEDVECSAELLRDIMAIAQPFPDRITPAPSVQTSPLLKFADLEIIKGAISGGMQDQHLSKIVLKAMKAAGAAAAGGGGGGGGNGEVREVVQGALGRLMLRVSVDVEGRLSRQVTALPFSRFQVEDVLWRRGLEAGRFMYEPPKHLLPESMLQKRRDGSLAPPTLVVLGNKYRALVRLGTSSSKLLWRQIKHLPEAERTQRKSQATQLSALLTGLARALFDRRIRDARSSPTTPSSPGSPSLPRRFGGKRMAQIYNKFIKSPINVLRGAINVGRYQRTVPERLFPREVRRNADFMSDLREMQQGKRRLVRLRREAPTVHNPSGIRVEFNGLRKIMDDTVGRDTKFLQTGPTNAFVGRNFGITPHRAVRKECPEELAGPGVSTGVDALAERLLMLRRGKRSSYWACEKGQKGLHKHRIKLPTVSEDRLKIDETLRVAREFTCAGNRISTETQARVLQRAILHRNSWPIQIRKDRFSAWKRASDLNDLPLTLEDEAVQTNKDAARLVGSPDGGTLHNYVDVISGLFGGASVVADDFDLEILTLLIHRAALRRGVYVWRSVEDKAWAREFGAGDGDSSEDWHELGQEPPTDTRTILREWLGEFGIEGSVVRYSVGRWKNGRLIPLALIRIRNSRASNHLQKGGIHVSNARGAGPSTFREAIRAACPSILPSLLRDSTSPSPRFMVADQVREVDMATTNPGHAGNWVGVVSAMMSYVTSRKTRAGNRSWMCSLAFASPTSYRIAFALHQVLWFQPLGAIFEGAIFDGKRSSADSATAYRPPLLAAEASLIIWTLIRIPA